MPLTSSLRRTVGFAWRGILSAASAGQSVWQTVTGITRVFARQGIPTGIIDIGAVDQLTGLAQSWAHANITTAAAPDEAAVTPAMIALAPWSMPPEQYATQPGYHLVVGITVEGQEAPVYRTITGITALPATVGGLRDLALANAQAMSVGTTPGGGVGGTVTGLSSLVVTVAPSGA